MALVGTVDADESNEERQPAGAIVPAADVAPGSAATRGRQTSLGLVGVAGILLLVGGCGAGIVAYDKKYFPGGPLEQQAIARGESSGPSPVWDVVTAIGTLALVAGVLLILASIVGAVVRVGRAARGSGDR